jgi:excinuclease ABC subunit A
MRKEIKEDISEKNENELKEYTEIIVEGAREHNLKNLSVKIQRDKLTVITGLSGSGKSSLAFDTLYAEGQRRYVETMSPYAKQFLGMMKKPEVDRIEGLSPAISIEQKTLSKNPRSTVGTVTEIYDYIRLLFARIGVQYSVEANVPVVKKSPDQIIEEILDQFSDQKIMILSPIIRGRKGHYRELFENFTKEGFTRARIDGEIKEIMPGMQLTRYVTHDIELVIDRCVVNQEQEHRISESLELSLEKGEGTTFILYEKDVEEGIKEGEGGEGGEGGKGGVKGGGGWESKFFSINYSCPVTGKAYRALAPNRFSFNSPYGACKKCDGLGYLRDFMIDLLIPDWSLTINQGAIQALEAKRGNWLYMQLTAFAEQGKINLEIPIKNISEDILNIILYGTDGETVSLEHHFGSGQTTKYKMKFGGIIPSYAYQLQNATTSAQKKKFENLQRTFVCPDCDGGRLNRESLFVRIADKNVADVINYDISESYDFFNNLTSKLTQRQNQIAELIIKEILTRLDFLKNVGLTYLTLGRSAKTLSGGESQRIRLASQIGSQLVGIMYVLDEPSIGLHQHDNNRLINSLKKLRDLGNTLIIVEHDKAMIEAADEIIDIGPGAGVHGGELVLHSKPEDVFKMNGKASKSITAKYLQNILDIKYSSKRRSGNGEYLKLSGAEGNNLKSVNFKLPLAKFVCITGMSGSGKSSLINDTLVPILMNKFYKSHRVPLKYKKIEGTEHIDKLIEIDQSPIGRSPRSNPATYTGIFTLIRDFFAMLPESRVRGYKTGRFSFNVKDGRCPECEGAGLKKIEMNFLPDVYVECTVCGGARYNRETLEVKYKHKTIADVLDMTVEEAMNFFSELPKIHHKIKTLNDVGLSYIKLGQQAPTLSGGEAQRIKLGTELSKRSTGKTLYLLDEPTTGLHFHDINLLMNLLGKLVDKGNTVVVIEHNLEVIKCADWIIDLGPEGGQKGGEIIAEGTPEQIIKKRKSLTARYLKEEMS